MYRESKTPITIIGELLTYDISIFHVISGLANLEAIAPLLCSADNFMDLYEIEMNHILLLRTDLAWLAKR